ncbi:MAG: hypothetical protein ACRCU2_25595 [Planktothrix sp.]
MIKLNPSSLLYINICISIGIGIISPLVFKAETGTAILFSLFSLILSLLLEIWMKIEELKKTQKKFIDEIKIWKGSRDKESENLSGKFSEMIEDFNQSIFEKVPSTSNGVQVFKNAGFQLLDTHKIVQEKQDELLLNVFELVCADILKTLTEISQGNYSITKERYPLGKRLREFLEKIIEDKKIHSLKGISYGKVEQNFHFWETGHGKGFLELNVKALINGCKVQRVFIVDESEDDKSYLIKEQREKGIEVYTCSYHKLDLAVRDNLVPCVIVNDKWVFVPNIVSENNKRVASGEEGFIFTNAEDVKKYVEDFNKLIRFSRNTIKN